MQAIIATRTGKKKVVVCNNVKFREYLGKLKNGNNSFSRFRCTNKYCDVQVLMDSV